MNLSVFLSNFENTCTTLTDGYCAAFCGGSTTDGYTPPGLTLAISFPAVFPPPYPPRCRAAEDSQYLLGDYVLLSSAAISKHIASCIADSARAHTLCFAMKAKGNLSILKYWPISAPDSTSCQAGN